MINSNRNLVVNVITVVFLLRRLNTTFVWMPLTIGGLPFLISVPNERLARNMYSVPESFMIEKLPDSLREI